MQVKQVGGAGLGISDERRNEGFTIPFICTWHEEVVVQEIVQVGAEFVTGAIGG